jgi:hypothetical protein
MKSSIKRRMAAAVVVVIGAGLGFAPVAVAATGVTHPAPTPTSSAPAPPQYETGTDPLVPSNTGAMPFVLVPRGNGLAF